MRHQATQLSIVTEKMLQDEILTLLKEEGVKGFTMFEGEGSGEFHLQQAHHFSLVDEFKIVKVEAIIVDRPMAERIAERLLTEYFEDQPGIVSLTDTEIYRRQKF